MVTSRARTRSAAAMPAAGTTVRGVPAFALWPAAMACFGMALMLLMTHWGVGISPDSVHYIQAARQLAENAVGGAEGEAVLIQHAPFYALLLAGGELAGIDPLEGARWLSVVLFGLNIYLVASIIGYTSRHATWLWAVGALLMCAFPVIVNHAIALSEPVFLLTTLLGFVLLGEYIGSARVGFLVGAALSIGLAFLARYAGAAVVLTGGLILLLNAGTLMRRVRDVILFGVVASLPMLAWMLRNLSAASTATGRELIFHPIDRSHVWQALYTLSGWVLIPASAPDIVRIAFWGAVGVGGVFVVARWFAAGVTWPPVIISLACFTVVYGGFLVLSISFLDANTPFDDRILLPVFAAGLVVALYLLDSVWPGIRKQPALAAVVIAGLALFTSAHLARSARLIATGYSQGWGFNSRAWQESPIMAQVKSLPAGVPIFSNAPEVVYLHTGRPAQPIPKRWFAMTRRPNEQFQDEWQALERRLEAESGVVVYLTGVAEQRSLLQDPAFQSRRTLYVRATEEDGVILGAATRQ